MNYKLLSLLFLSGLLSTVETKGRRLTEVPPNEQCIFVTYNDPSEGFNLPIPLDVRRYSDAQIENGQKREVDFTNASGNLHAKMTSLYMQDGSHLSYTYIDGRPLTTEFVYFQFKYTTFDGDIVQERYKVHTLGDCIVFNSGAELNPGIIPTDQLDVQVFFNFGDPN